MFSSKCLQAISSQIDQNLIGIRSISSLFSRFRSKHNQARAITEHSETYPSYIVKNERLPKTEEFRFTDYDCIGFDMDNTICRYQIGNMVKMEYEAISKYLVEKKGYPDKYLYRPIEENLDFILKGLILDLQRGNILRIDPQGYILHGSHGTRELSRDDLFRYYGEECRWEVTDMFRENPLHTWNGPLSEKMRTLLDYFDMPAGLIFGRLIDTLDEQQKHHIHDDDRLQYTIWPDIVCALHDMFQREHFASDRGGYFPHIKRRPHHFYRRCSSRLLHWLHSLRARGIKIFLVTGSHVDFVQHTAANAMGEGWRDLFDITIAFARKPGFFTGSRPFLRVDPLSGHEGEEVPAGAGGLQKGGMYTQGNWNGLHGFLKRETGLEEPRVLYVGDNLIQDVYAPSVHTICDTVAVCEELEAEGVFGHLPTHEDRGLLTSSRWGSYFHHQAAVPTGRCTIWRDIIARHSRLCVPSLEYVAQFAVDKPYRNI